MTSILPIYVENALHQRSQYIRKARKASMIIDEYAKQIGVDFAEAQHSDAAFLSDIKMYCEVDCAESSTREYLISVLKKLSTPHDQ